MAAEIRPENLNFPAAGMTSNTARNDGARPELVNKIDGGNSEVTAVIIVPDHDAIISVSMDRSVRLWLLRDNGQYWPSVCHYVGSAASAAAYDPPTRRLFVGLDNGSISEFSVAEDLNSMDGGRDYHAHRLRVTGLRLAGPGWLLSVGRDRYFQFHSVATGCRLGGYLASAWCTALQFDERSRYAFVGDYAGQITVVALAQEAGVKLVNVLKGHNGSIQSLTWDGSRGWLISGSYDSSVFVWDIAGRKGTVYELHGHRNKINSVLHVSGTNNLLSTGEDGNLVIWDLAARRDETSDWTESDTCQLCSRPFFWNFKAMYDQKQIGLRQHHCRKCGKAVCDSCSTKKCPLPIKGHEFPVRVCEECYIKVSEEEKKSLARFYDMKHCVRSMAYDHARKTMLTVGPDNTIKIWSFDGIM